MVAMNHEVVEAAQARDILVVENNDDARYLTAYVLKREGYRVSEARDAFEAQRLRRSGRKFDLLIANLSLDRMNGADLATWFKALDARIQVLIVADAPVQIEHYLEGETNFHCLDRLSTPAELVVEVGSMLDSRLACA